MVGGRLGRCAGIHGAPILVVHKKPRSCTQDIGGEMAVLRALSGMHEGGKEGVLCGSGVARVRGRRHVNLWQEHGVLGGEISRVF